MPVCKFLFWVEVVKFLYWKITLRLELFSKFWTFSEKVQDHEKKDLTTDGPSTNVLLLIWTKKYVIYSKQTICNTSNHWSKIESAKWSFAEHHGLDVNNDTFHSNNKTPMQPNITKIISWKQSMWILRMRNENNKDTKWRQCTRWLWNNWIGKIILLLLMTWSVAASNFNPRANMDPFKNMLKIYIVNTTRKYIM